MAKLLKNEGEAQVEPRKPKSDMSWLGGGKPSKPAALPKLQPSPPFLFKAHPLRWCVMGGEVIPMLSKLKVIQGINGIIFDRAGNPDFRNVARKAEDDGWVIVPMDIDGSPYAVQVPGLPQCWISKFEAPHAGLDYTTPKVKEYVEFCKSLVDKGVIEPISRPVLEALLDQSRKNYHAIADKAVSVPSLQKQAKDLSDVVAVCEQALELKILEEA